VSGPWALLLRLRLLRRPLGVLRLLALLVLLRRLRRLQRLVGVCALLALLGLLQRLRRLVGVRACRSSGRAGGWLEG
jgi:hypothetical protein